MTTSYDKSTAVVVLPPVGGRLRDTSLRDWLVRADLAHVEGSVELLRIVLDELGRDYPAGGLAALRMWGQTGDRPTVWMAAADPVYLEPRMSDLCLHELQRNGVPPSDLRPLIDHLQHVLGEERGVGFVRLRSCAYVTAPKPMTTASEPKKTARSRGERFVTGSAASEEVARLPTCGLHLGCDACRSLDGYL